MRIPQVSAAVFILLLGSVGLGQETAKNKFVAVIGADGVQKVEITGRQLLF